MRLGMWQIMKAKAKCGVLDAYNRHIHEVLCGRPHFISRSRPNLRFHYLLVDYVQVAGGQEFRWLGRLAG